MTPEEAIEQLANRLTTSRLKTVKALLDACVATARAEAKADETRRCTARVKALATLIEHEILSKTTQKDYKGSVQSIVNTVNSLANDLLITGRLEVEA